MGVEHSAIWFKYRDPANAGHNTLATILPDKSLLLCPTWMRHNNLSAWQVDGCRITNFGVLRFYNKPRNRLGFDFEHFKFPP